MIPFMLFNLSFIFFAALCVSSTSTQNEISNPLNLSSFIQIPSHSNRGVLVKALQVIEDLETTPSCNRAAAANLLESCRALDGNELRQNTHVALELMRSIFAARLAVCELTEANAAIPPQCHPFIPLTGSNQDSRIFCYLPGANCGSGYKKDGIRFPTVDSKKLAACLTSLESRPQWWTSYSNAKQNAALLCHATRFEIEKDDVLKVHKSLIEVVIALRDVITYSVQRHGENLVGQKHFLETLRKLQEEFKAEMRATNSRTLENFKSIAKTIETKMGAVYAVIAKTSEDIVQKTAALSKGLERTDVVVQNSQKSFHKAVNDITARSMDLSTQHDERLRYSHELVVALSQALTELKDKQIDSTQVAVVALQKDLKTAAQLVGRMTHQQDILNSRMVGLEGSLNDLLLQFRTFNHTFALQTQTHLDTLGKANVHLRNINEYAKQSAHFLETFAAIFSVFKLFVKYSSAVFLVVFLLIVLVVRNGARLALPRLTSSSKSHHAPDI